MDNCRLDCILFLNIAKIDLKPIFIQQFVTDITAYQDCINTYIEVAGADATDEFKAIMIGRFNAAATEIEAVAAAFNEQIAAFRAANP